MPSDRPRCGPDGASVFRPEARAAGAIDEDRGRPALPEPHTGGKVPVWWSRGGDGFCPRSGPKEMVPLRSFLRSFPIRALFPPFPPRAALRGTPPAMKFHAKQAHAWAVPMFPLFPCFLVTGSSEGEVSIILGAGISIPPPLKELGTVGTVGTGPKRPMEIGGFPRGRCSPGKGCSQGHAARGRKGSFRCPTLKATRPFVQLST